MPESVIAWLSERAFESSLELAEQNADVADMPGLSYGHLAFLTFQAVFQTIIICAIGYWAARHGILDRSAQKNISNLNVNVATPCLIFSKMASSLSLSALADIALIPVLFVLSTAVSYLSGRWVSRRFKFNTAESNFVTAMAVFGNSNSMPVSVTVALAYTLPILRWPDIPGDNAEMVVSRGILYLLIFQQLGQMLRWSWGYNTLLARPADRGDDIAASEDTALSQPPSAPPSAPRSRARSFIELSFYKALISDIKAFMNPPLWSMLTAVVVASIPALKYELYEKHGFASNTVGKAIQQIGNTAIPLILLVLGANLAGAEEADGSLAKSPKYSEIVFASLVSRMVLPAIVILPIIALSVKYLGISILDDPIFLVSSFILTVSPPAIQLSQICQLNQVFECEMAGVLFWGYVVLVLPSTILIVLFALQVLGWSGILS